MLLFSDLYTTLDIRLIPIWFYQHFRFNWKAYASYKQETWTICEKTNIFYLVSYDAIEVLSLKIIIVQILLVLLLRAAGGAIPCWKW